MYKCIQLSCGCTGQQYVVGSRIVSSAALCCLELYCGVDDHSNGRYMYINAGVKCVHIGNLYIYTVSTSVHDRLGSACDRVSAQW